MKQESIICLTLRRNAIIVKSWVNLSQISILRFTWRSPTLRIWRIANHCIYMQRVISIFLVILVKIRPIILQCVTISCYDVIWYDASHNEIHTSEVESILL